MNWQIASARYHDKKKNKLWISVLLEDKDNYIEKWECHKSIFCMVEFNNGLYQQINFSIPDCRGLKSIPLTDQQTELVINAAIETAKQYI